MNNRRISPKLAITIISIVCLVFISLTSCQLPGSKSATNQKQIAEVKRGNLIFSVDADGNLSLPKQAKLCFDTPGTVKEINVKEGDRVSKGQLLAKLDDITQQMAVDAAQTDVSIAKNKLQKRICPSQYGGTFEYANTPGVLDTLDEIQKELEKAIELIESQKYDEAHKELFLAQDDFARAKRIFAESYVKTYTHGLDEATLITLTLELDKAKIALERAKEDLKKTVIIAPFDGVVADVGVDEGDILSSMNYATTIVVQLIDPTMIEIEGLVDEIDIPGVRIGQEAIITVDAFPDIELEGKVTFVSPVATIQAGIVSYKVTLNLQPTANPELKEGMTTTAEIIIDRKDNVLLIPERAIKDKDKEPWVEVVKNGTVEPRKVTLGMTDGRNVEVISGLMEGENVTVESVRPPVPSFF